MIGQMKTLFCFKTVIALALVIALFIGAVSA
jgi:hypothetical protein